MRDRIGSHRSGSPRRTASAALGAAALLIASLIPVSAAGATSPHDALNDPTATAEVAVFAPAAQGSDRGPRGNRITVSTVALPAAGGSVVVRGRGFDRKAGIYVGLCVTPRPGQKPSPCGGGVDTDGSSQASAWISSNPPPYGSSLAIPYGPGGSFKVRLKVSPIIRTATRTFDCRVVSCSITTRADHLRPNDRTWDLGVRMRFG